MLQEITNRMINYLIHHQYFKELAAILDRTSQMIFQINDKTDYYTFINEISSRPNLLHIYRNHIWNQQHCQYYALISSAEKGYINVVRHLIMTGSNLYIDECEPLIRASKHGHLKVVMYLIKVIEYEKVNEIGFTFYQAREHNLGMERALLWASSFDHLEVVKFLVKSGANTHSLSNCALERAMSS